ncbi:hypothetical protein AB0P23_14315 [Rhodococcus sp. NPDC077669]|uniref:hypothetical protein n=1 Tax=Rhodococcus sp. NPDC077669 TaxID=3155174 RepID=UPI0034365434
MIEPIDVLRAEFGRLVGPKRLLIFGSWAARYLGVPGLPSRDIDVLCLGDPSLRPAVYAAADISEIRLRDECALSIPVNPIVRSYDSWLRRADPLLREIQSSPCIVLTPPT